MMQSAGTALNLSITGSERAGNGPQSGTGHERSVTGSGQSLATVVPMTGVMASDPAETNRNLARQLPPQIGLYIAADGNLAALETRWRMYGVPDRQTLLKAASATTAAMGNPASEDELNMALAGLRTVTKARETADEDMDLSNAIMARELMGYPRDVAMSAIKAAARQSTFMPSLSELIELCNSRMGYRATLHRLIERALSKMTD